VVEVDAVVVVVFVVVVVVVTVPVIIVPVFVVAVVVGAGQLPHKTGQVDLSCSRKIALLLVQNSSKLRVHVCLGSGTPSQSPVVVVVAVVVVVTVVAVVVGWVVHVPQSTLHSALK
jgi:hypothetical protein